MKIRAPLAIVAVLILPAISHLAMGTDGGETLSKQYVDTPYHLQILDNLINDYGDVIPPPPPVHPVTAIYNREAIIPPMCYTRTEGKFNPCYVCHQDPAPGRENTMADGELQIAYSFSELGLTNHWKNLFEDRSARVNAISDREITEWIRTDNYSELGERLREVDFKGWIPDLDGLEEGAHAFGPHGIAKDGSHWVAFNYKPFPSTFWPTNGNTDDVMVRLDSPYRTDAGGNYSEDVYRANLAIVEMNIKGMSEISVAAIDEAQVGVDLDGDGKLFRAEKVKQANRYVGSASDHLFQKGIYPAGTEFLHTVRYIDFDTTGQIRPSRRMKEIRYIKKWVAYPLVALQEYYREEGYAKDEGLLPGYSNLRHYGLDNGMGWSVHGFIENNAGRLRAYTYEENLACMGCHNSIGSTIDKTFSFPRKVDGAAGWGYINLTGMPDAPNLGETSGEILTYLSRAGGGGEFRSNPEMQQRWFKADGTVDRDKVLAAPDVATLISPSKERAMALNKAYRVIVDDQDYIFGRDATVVPPKNVYKAIDNEDSPTLPLDTYHTWDIRLKWGAKPLPLETAKAN